jgi:hypothetical protein
MLTRCSTRIVRRAIGKLRASRTVFLPRTSREIVDLRPRPFVHRLDRIVLRLTFTRLWSRSTFHVVQTHDSPPFSVRHVQRQRSKTRAARTVRTGDGAALALEIGSRAGSTSKPEGGRVRKFLAVALIVLGVVALAYGNISFTRQEKVVDLGPVEVTKEKRETIPLTPIAGGAFLIAGVAMLAIRSRA